MTGLLCQRLNPLTDSLTYSLTEISGTTERIAIQVAYCFYQGYERLKKKLLKQIQSGPGS